MNSISTIEGIDLTSALRFLKALDPFATSFNFRSLDDRGQTAARLHDDVSLADLDALMRSCEAKRLGLFVVINSGGQRASTITRVRALFLDIDRKSRSESECEALRRYAVEGRMHDTDQQPASWPQPTAVVASGGGGYHVYWMIDDLPTASFTRLQRELADIFSGDAACVDLPRVMRLPGSIHHKASPTQVRLIDCDERRRYATDNLLACIGIESASREDERSTQNSVSAVPASDPVLAWLSHRTHLLKSGGRRSPNTPIDVVCPNVATGQVRHSEPDSLTSTVYLPHGLNGKRRAFHCSHGQCVELKIGDFLQHIGYEKDCPDPNSDDGMGRVLDFV